MLLPLLLPLYLIHNQVMHLMFGGGALTLSDLIVDAKIQKTIS